MALHFSNIWYPRPTATSQKGQTSVFLEADDGVVFLFVHFDFLDRAAPAALVLEVHLYHLLGQGAHIVDLKVGTHILSLCVSENVLFAEAKRVVKHAHRMFALIYMYMYIHAHVHVHTHKYITIHTVMDQWFIKFTSMLLGFSTHCTPIM